MAAKVELFSKKNKGYAINGEKFAKASDTYTTEMQEKASLALFEHIYEKRGGKIFPETDFKYDSFNDINLMTGVSKEYGMPTGNGAKLKAWENKKIAGKTFPPKLWMPGNNTLPKNKLFVGKIGGLSATQSKKIGIPYYKDHSYSAAQDIIFEYFPAKHHADTQWLQNFYKQQSKVFDTSTKIGKSQLGGDASKFDHYDRSTSGAFMEWISKLVGTRAGISKKDTWNPADVWLVNDYEQVKKDIEGALGQVNIGSKKVLIHMLNNIMVTLMRQQSNSQSPSVVGISLKKISGKAALWEVVNLDPKAYRMFIPGKGANVYQFNKSHTRSKCSLNVETGNYLVQGGAAEKTWKGKLSKFSQSKSWKNNIDKLAKTKKIKNLDYNILAFGTMEASMIISEDGKDWFELPLKSSSTSSNKPQNLKFEPKPLAAPGARAGRAQADEVRELFVKLGAPFANDATKYPADSKAWKKAAPDYERMVDRISGKFIDCGGVNGKTFINTVTRMFLQVDLLDFEKRIDMGFTAWNKKQKEELSPPSEDDGDKKGERKDTSDRLRYNIVSKLMQVDCLDKLRKLKDKKSPKNKDITHLDIWVTYVCFMAQKKGKGFGPFGKLY